jgi:hypothetical protein
MNMLNAMYRAMVIGRARSAAEQIARNMSNRQLADIGHDRWSLVDASVKAMKDELDAKEAKRKIDAICYPDKPGLWVIYKYFHFQRPT